MMKYFLFSIIILVLAGGAFFILSKENVAEINSIFLAGTSTNEINQNHATTTITTATTTAMVITKFTDIEPQKPLANPPKEIKAVYATSWTAGYQKRMDSLINLIKETELNAIVIDIKDYSGYIAYDTNVPEVDKYGAEEIKIPYLNTLIKRLHDENIYVIARITVFQDPVLAKARPDLAIHSRSKMGSATSTDWTISNLWLDHKKLAWIDPASKEAWDYNIAISKDALSRGFDELNFDYIRFASDGNLADMRFPNWDGKTYKSTVIRNFFKYLREKLAGAKISADLFGLSTINSDDLGIGQIIESTYGYFDYVAPMVYPSHYAKGFLGYKNPAQYPYEVVKYSMEHAVQRLADYNNSTSSVLIVNTKLRPWLQDFDLGADYTASMIKEQIQATYDSASSTPELIDGFMLWDPRNVYTEGALEKQ